MYIHTHIHLPLRALASCVAMATHTLSCGAVQSFFCQTAGRVAPVSPFTHIVLINSFTAKYLTLRVCVCAYKWLGMCVFILKPTGYYTVDQRFRMCGVIVSCLFWALSVPTSKRCHWLIVLLKAQFYSMYVSVCVCVCSLQLRWSHPWLDSVPLSIRLVRRAALSSQEWALTNVLVILQSHTYIITNHFPKHIICLSLIFHL